MENPINWKAVERKWDDYKDHVKDKWRKLTDDDLNQIHGDRHRLMTALQDRYNMTKDKVEEQVNTFFSEAGSWFDEARDKVVEVARKGKEYIQETNLPDMASDVKALISKYPITAALIGIGLGYLCGRMFTSHRS
jgi:uncharacterized protein YjbJ (UPF0337 family)